MGQDLDTTSSASTSAVKAVVGVHSTRTNVSVRVSAMHELFITRSARSRPPVFGLFAGGTLPDKEARMGGAHVRAIALHAGMVTGGAACPSA